ncbi:FecR domain-containing protein [Roseimaritima ulvae]|uniref:FecR protein n=1 Tax=Roseimaritima ulvae TaxID=980254 RepID=A0A5B9R3M4_9BACT|nr:FecR domain-containing protein [Roseimaritima ulvae]QEG40933.1 FecR protein [Roseimaritima ulvae]
MKYPKHFSELWTSYLEGELDERGLAQLSEMLEADEALVQHAADLFQTHRLLGLASQSQPQRQDQFVRQTLASLPADPNEFIQRVMSRVGDAAHSPQSPMPRPLVSAETRMPGQPSGGFLYAMIATAALGLFAVGLLVVRWQSPTVAQPQQAPANATQAAGNVRLASISQAKFFGELSPPVDSLLVFDREYVLTSGLIEVAFPAGASAILEGPAVFRVTSDESLALDIGRCSVHAPDGAEGFRIDTPAKRIVDRGTRFSVSVADTSETEVQVIEGAADVYDRSVECTATTPSEIRLQIGEARRFTGLDCLAADRVAFDASVYRRELPDRIVSYQATEAADGGAERLTEVTLQRGGRLTSLPVADLIPARIDYFKSTEPRAYLCGSPDRPQSIADLVSDPSLVSGVINPDGSLQALTTSPVLSGAAATPGFAIQFQRPVRNGPGADVVFFDLQTFGNPSDGDAFHVSPLAFREGLQSHTVRRYDLTMESPEVRELTKFHVHFFDQAAESITMLEDAESVSRAQGIRFRALAVGIDLSDLGYADGESVGGLFFQDASDDNDRVDPVYIGGLPEIQ